MALNVNIDNVTLEIISTRLKNVVSPLDIIKWLANFKAEEIDLAIDIISNLTVYTTYEIEEILNGSFLSLFDKIEKGSHLVIHPIGEFGKSGSMITYLFQKTEFYKNNKDSIILQPTINNFEFKEELNYSLILLDDFVGSGDTIKNYYKTNIHKLRSNFHDVFFVGVAGMINGVEKISVYFDKVEIPRANIFKKCFSSTGSTFGYRKYYNHRDLAYKYGIKLTKSTKDKHRKSVFREALGYENSQALISFAYGSPNNTLPIIWANKKKWIPLIPRFSIDKISTARNFRKSILYELSILKEFGSDNLRDNFFSLKIKKGSRTFSSVNRIDFSLYAIIRLSRAGYTPISICQKLGILYKDYEEYLNNGKEKGIFEEENKLSMLGLLLYNDAKKCIEARKKSFEFEFKDLYATRAIKYIPKRFNGRS